MLDENYIDIVRKSLYKEFQNKIGNSHEMPRKSKKIKFSMDHYNSETVFTKSKSEKLQNRKCTPFKKKESKKKKVMSQNGDSSFEDANDSMYKLKHRKPTPFKKKVPKKKQVVISFSSNESFEEDIKDDLLSPSKSELEFFQNTFKKSTKRNIFDESSESEESVSEFNLDNFFNTRELSLNESITEAHSGIDYEFVSDNADDVKIVGSDLSISQAKGHHFKQEKEHETNVTEDVIEINDTDVSNSDVEYITNECDENISAVVTQLQESMVIDEPVNSIISESPQLQEEECDLFRHAAEYYDLEDWKLVILKERQSICVYGLFTLKVLYGKVEVLGYILDKHSKEVNVYSPRGSALLQIKSITDIENNEKLELKKILLHFTFEESINDIAVEISSAIIKCSKLEDTRILFVEKYISQQIFPKIDNNLPQVIFEPTENWNVIKESNKWDEILNTVEASTKLLLAGGKGVGKSTFLRFAINRLLNKFNEVRVIDLDPGQSEFAVPGCISIVTVTEPILGPNYTHLKASDRSILSNINIGHDPVTYIKCIKYLLMTSETLEECPTLVNYMGFVHGIGLNLISAAISHIQPTDIVQIQSNNYNRNFKADLSYETVHKNCNMFADRVDNNSVLLNYKLHKVPAMSDGNEGWALEPRQSREMCILAYLGQMMPRGVNSLTSHELPMYEINLSSVKITNLRGEEISPAVANANLVALCSLEGFDIFKCLGYGVVRGIDVDSESLVLLTPEAPSVLEEVYYLVIVSVTLPPSVYMTPDDVKGHIPYVMKGELVSLGQITKRSYLPANKK
ncbi:hypothetical protein NQ314_010926 [Rhamnusium bicolor]|uniref:Polynucleotide 5'-hydroxyl-kinase NOL9 n=1 Tax=Rhamnusium bicolor TaxID=1586634 RepID=A0AAV8XN00_9CUCU|nr:hypothetical protein NQ314_010926 [Rhamnusium bicolor]